MISDEMFVGLSTGVYPMGSNRQMEYEPRLQL